MRTPADYEFPANVPFVRFDERGAVTAFGQMARGIVWDFQDAGQRILIGEGTDADDYVDLAGIQPILRKRPPAAWAFDRQELLPRQEARMRDLPPAKVTFTGPTAGSQPHETRSDLMIGWTMPGDYVVTIDAWPAKTLVVPLKVMGKTGASSSVKAEVKL